MIRQLCPHCLAGVELPDAAAGSAVDCPVCNKPIAVPAGYVPTVAAQPRTAPAPEPTVLPPSDAPPPPPGFVPPKPPPAAGAAEPRPAASAGGTIPGWLAWVPAAGLAVAFLLTFFPWVGCYPGGVRIYTQTPWQAASGSFTTNPLPNQLVEDEADLLRVIRVSGWMLLYLPLLLATLAAAWVERLVPDPAANPRLAPLTAVWPHRWPILAGLTAVLLVLLFTQVGVGFGLHGAVRQAAVDKVTAPPADGKPAEPATNETNRQILTAARVGMEANKLGAQGTTALELALIAHLLAAAAAGGWWWLSRRGGRPLPRLTLTY